MDQRIDGLPVGVKILAIRKPVDGDWFLYENCVPMEYRPGFLVYPEFQIIITMDNV